MLNYLTKHNKYFSLVLGLGCLFVVILFLYAYRSKIPDTSDWANPKYSFEVKDDISDKDIGEIMRLIDGIEVGEDEYLRLIDKRILSVELQKELEILVDGVELQPGDIVVVTGENSGGLSGLGNIFYFRKTENRWVLFHESAWLA